MTNHIEPEFLALTDTASFDAFWRDNAESLPENMTYEIAFALACNCELIVGGGAAPLFRVGFVDKPRTTRIESAAPELYRALRGFLLGGPCDAQLNALFGEDVVRDARAAIAKAEGRAQ